MTNTNTDRDKEEEYDLKRLVLIVSSAMTHKLLTKAETRSGWQDPDEIPFLKESLREHFDRYIAGDDEQLIDVINLAAMLFWHLINPPKPISQTKVCRQRNPRRPCCSGILSTLQSRSRKPKFVASEIRGEQ